MKTSDLIKCYIELMKPRILFLVLITTSFGYYMGGKGSVSSFATLFFLLAGVALTCAGSATLNHYLERDADGKMLRTQNRPLVKGFILPTEAMVFGILLVLSGVFLLWSQVNLLTAFLGLLTAFLYVLVYTPMKRLSWLNTSIGAIPGALPPVGGWCAATGEISAGAWILFAILFAWQHPHFYSIAWMFREDYKRGGFKMLPVVHPDGISTVFQIILFAVILIPVSLLPTVAGLSGKLYFYGALTLGMALILACLHFASKKSERAALHLLKATVYYLPCLLMFCLIDRTF